MRDHPGQAGFATGGDGPDAAAAGSDGSVAPRTAAAGWERTDPTIAVAEALAEAEGVAVTELPPLFDTLDADALNALLMSAPRDARVSFAHLGHEVVVSGRGEVEVHPSGRD